jgi:hypothetical protein
MQEVMIDIMASKKRSNDKILWRVKNLWRVKKRTEEGKMKELMTDIMASKKNYGE